MIQDISFGALRILCMKDIACLFQYKYIVQAQACTMQRYVKVIMFVTPMWLDRDCY